MRLKLFLALTVALGIGAANKIATLPPYDSAADVGKVPVIGATGITWSTASAVTGAVSGATGVTGNLPMYSTGTGKAIKDSGIAANTVVIGPASAVSGDVAIYSGTTGKLTADTGILGTNIGLITSTLAQFAATTSAQFFGVISDETGTGAVVGASGPALMRIGVDSNNGNNAIGATGSLGGAGIRAVGGATGAGGVFVGGVTSGNGITVNATAGNSAGGVFAGTGSGAGATFTGGQTGVGLTATAGGGNTNGANITGTGTGIGLNATGGSTNGSTAVFCGGGGSNGVGCFGNATGTGTGVIANSVSGYGVSISTDTTSPVKAAMFLNPQDATPSGANVVGDMYMGTAGDLWANSSAGTPGTWFKVGKKGSTTNDNAAAGEIGETMQLLAHVASGSIALTTATTCNVGSATCPSTGGTQSITLTAGDWDIVGSVGFNPGATTSVTRFNYGVSKTSATLSASDTRSYPTACELQMQESTAASVPGSDINFAIPQFRCSISGSTTIYLVAQSTFTVSTMGVYGWMEARRVR